MSTLVFDEDLFEKDKIIQADPKAWEDFEQEAARSLAEFDAAMARIYLPPVPPEPRSYTFCAKRDLEKLVPTPSEFEATFNACFAEFERIINRDIILDMVVIPPSTFPSIRYAVTGERASEQRELKRVLAACGVLLASFHWRNGRKRKRMRILATKVIASYGRPS